MSRPVVGDLVRWRMGYWKVIKADPMERNVRLRWVMGSRPDEGIFHDVSKFDVTPLTDIETIALYATDKAWL